MSYQAGDTYPASITIRDADGNPAEPDSLTLSVRDPSGEVTPHAYLTDAIIVRDSAGFFHADVPLTDPGMWMLAWATTNEAQVEGVQIWVSPAPTAAITFATLDELALRLPGAATTAADLTPKQAAQGQMLLETVTDLIITAVDRDVEWAATLNPIARELRAVCLEAVARVMQNPGGARSESETLGAHSYATSYTDGAHGLDLTDREIALCRRAVLGQTSGSAHIDSILRPGNVGEIVPPITGWIGD